MPAYTYSCTTHEAERDNSRFGLNGSQDETLQNLNALNEEKMGLRASMTGRI